MEIINDIHEAGIDGILDLFRGGYDLFYSYLHSLSDMQALAFSHLLVFIVVYFLFLNIFSVLLGNWLIEYFKIGEKYPRLGKWLSYRQKFRNYYLTLNCFVTMSIISFAFYVDILVLLHR